jgi:hypothetical protein
MPILPLPGPAATGNEGLRKASEDERHGPRRTAEDNSGCGTFRQVPRRRLSPPARAKSCPPFESRQSAIFPEKKWPFLGQKKGAMGDILDAATFKDVHAR